MISKTPSILTIDDDIDNLELISKILDNAFKKVSIYSASSGTAGLRLADKYRPDTIILDVLMPDMDGFAVCEKLKKNDYTKNIPVIIITGSNANIETKVRALELGADAFLAKPIRKAELIAQLKVMLRIKFAEDKIRYEKKTLERIVKQRTEKLHLLTTHNITLQEEEKSRISRELHDELGQMLVGLQMGHDSLLRIIDKKKVIDRDVLRLKVTDLIGITEQSFNSVRKIIHNLRPPVLDHLGLFSAIEWLIKDFSKKCDISIMLDNSIKDNFQLTNEQNISIFRIIQESLTNAIRHSNATELLLRIYSKNNIQNVFEIIDNGIGFDLNKLENFEGFGLLGMRERAVQYNWTLDLLSKVGKGTTVKLTI